MNLTSLRMVADTVTIVVGVVSVAVIAWAFLAGTPQFDAAEAEASAIGVQLHPSLEVVLSPDADTLIISLQSDCVFCQQSAPFYRQLLERNRGRVRTVVAAPPHDRGVTEYLAAEDIEPDKILFIELGLMPISVTPTVLIVDEEGVVTGAWIGLLDSSREAQVINALFGSTDGASGQPVVPSPLGDSPWKAAMAPGAESPGKSGRFKQP